MRTAFVLRDGNGVQQITEQPALPIDYSDLREVAQDLREERLLTLLEEEAQITFDLAQCPLLRIRLLCLAEQDHALIVNMHHIIADGWSIGVLMTELSVLYAAHPNDTSSSPLPELSIQYADFGEWQRSWLDDERLQTQLDYWKNQLQNMPAMDLPYDRPRPQVSNQAGAELPLTIDPTVYANIGEFAKSQGATSYMVLLAVLQTLLHRHCGQDVIAVASPVAGRIRPELEGLIGFFANTVIIKTDFSGNPDFHEVVARVKYASLAAQANQDAPLEKIQALVQPGRQTDAPFIQVTFALQDISVSTLSLPGLQVETIAMQRGTAKFDLIFSIWQGDNGITGSIEYSTELFDQETIIPMAQQYQYLLSHVLECSGVAVSELAMEEVLVERGDDGLLITGDDQPVFEEDLNALLEELSEDELEGMLADL